MRFDGALEPQCGAPATNARGGGAIGAANRRTSVIRASSEQRFQQCQQARDNNNNNNNHDNSQSSNNNKNNNNNNNDDNDQSQEAEDQPAAADASRRSVSNSCALTSEGNVNSANNLNGNSSASVQQQQQQHRVGVKHALTAFAVTPNVTTTQTKTIIARNDSDNSSNIEDNDISGGDAKEDAGVLITLLQHAITTTTSSSVASATASVDVAASSGREQKMTNHDDSGGSRADGGGRSLKALPGEVAISGHNCHGIVVAPSASASGLWPVSLMRAPQSLRVAVGCTLAPVLKLLSAQRRLMPWPLLLWWGVLLGGSALLPVRVVRADDGDNFFAVNGFSMGPETTTPEFDYASRGQKKFGDKCDNTLECGFPGSICDPKKKSCQCTEDLSATNHIDKCGKEAAVNESCFFNEQCETKHYQTECRDGRCACRFEMTPTWNKDGTVECKGRQDTRSGEETYIDPAMIMVLVGMALMFIIICVVLRLFSQARWRENRTIFNTPNPRLMNVSLLRESKLLHGQERRGSRMSVRAPSRQPSMASLRPHSPNPSLGSHSNSHGSNASAASVRSTRSNSVAPGNVVTNSGGGGTGSGHHDSRGKNTTSAGSHHQHQHASQQQQQQQQQQPHHHHHQPHHHNQQQQHSQQPSAMANITANPVADSVTVEIIEPRV